MYRSIPTHFDFKKWNKNHFGAKGFLKQAHFDLSLTQLSPSIFYGTTVSISLCIPYF